MVEKLALATKELLQTIYRDGIDIKTLHKLASSCFMQTDRRSSKIGRRAKSALAIRYWSIVGGLLPAMHLWRDARLAWRLQTWCNSRGLGVSSCGSRLTFLIILLTRKRDSDALSWKKGGCIVAKPKNSKLTEPSEENLSHLAKNKRSSACSTGMTMASMWSYLFHARLSPFEDATNIFNHRFISREKFIHFIGYTRSKSQHFVSGQMTSDVFSACMHFTCETICFDRFALL